MLAASGVARAAQVRAGRGSQLVTGRWGEPGMSHGTGGGICGSWPGTDGATTFFLKRNFVWYWPLPFMYGTGQGGCAMEWGELVRWCPGAGKSWSRAVLVLCQGMVISFLFVSIRHSSCFLLNWFHWCHGLGQVWRRG